MFKYIPIKEHPCDKLADRMLTWLNDRYDIDKSILSEVYEWIWGSLYKGMSYDDVLQAQLKDFDEIGVLKT